MEVPAMSHPFIPPPDPSDHLRAPDVVRIALTAWQRGRVFGQREAAADNDRVLEATGRCPTCGGHDDEYERGWVDGAGRVVDALVPDPAGSVPVPVDVCGKCGEQVEYVPGVDGYWRHAGLIGGTPHGAVAADPLGALSATVTHVLHRHVIRQVLTAVAVAEIGAAHLRYHRAMRHQAGKTTAAAGAGDEELRQFRAINREAEQRADGYRLGTRWDAEGGSTAGGGR